MPRRYVPAEPLEPRRLLAAYTLIDLGTLGGAGGEAFDLNDQDQVVGFAQNVPDQHRAFVFSDANGNRVADPGEMVDLGTLPGDVASYAYGINNDGQIVGSSRSAPLGVDGIDTAVRFNPGAAPTDFALGASSNAMAIGPGGEIVGGMTVRGAYVAFERRPDGAVTTFTLPAPFNVYAEARGTNGGAVVGYSGGGAGDSGFIRTANGTLTAVGHDSPFMPYQYAWDINAAGQVVGEGFDSQASYVAFVWLDGVATSLGTLPGFGSSAAYGINDRGEIVGKAEPPEGQAGTPHAFLYSGGVMRDLNALIAPGSGYVITEARDVNSSGNIAAVARSPQGLTRPVMLVRNPPIAGRYIFYNNSVFDGFEPAANTADDAAIAPDKQAGTAQPPGSFANVTGYSRGINGIMIDLSAPSSALGSDDFEFRVGTGGAPETWAAAPQPQTISVRPGAGASGSDRVTLVWADGAIRNRWLQVTVRANGDTGLSTPDVFVFGNLVGETGDAAGLAVTAQDVFATRLRLGGSGAQITDRNDFDRDGRVSVRDVALARRNVGATLQTAGLAASAATIVLPVARAPLARRSALRELLDE